MTGVLTEQNIAMAFGTPISSHLWPDSEGVNAALRDTVMAREAESNGIGRSNVGGWHSTQDLLKWDAPGIDDMRARIVGMSLDLVRLAMPDPAPFKEGVNVDCWANISRNGNYNALHDHPNSVWSGVYYVSSGTPEPQDETNGKLEFFDPRQGASMMGHPLGNTSGRFTVDPLPGLMVMFPSWLKHMVHPFFGTGERISISFNITPKPEGA
jgi:uncharacterized protein (TIGR02466 family)